MKYIMFGPIYIDILEQVKTIVRKKNTHTNGYYWNVGGEGRGWLARDMMKLSRVGVMLYMISQMGHYWQRIVSGLYPLDVSTTQPSLDNQK